jgi:hypothetical protein
MTLQRCVVFAQQVHLLLREVADRQPLALDDLAAQRRQHVGDGLHQRGLALAVGAQDADALAGEHGAVDVAHDDRLAIPAAHLLQATTSDSASSPARGTRSRIRFR